MNRTEDSMNRTEALCRAFGWQGGTIHQIAAETGCEVEDLLYGNPSTRICYSEYTGGWFAGRTCSLEHNLKGFDSEEQRDTAYLFVTQERNFFGEFG